MTAPTFANFISAPSNEVALHSAARIVDWPDQPNPLVITGRAGCGKTHLLEAIAASYAAEDTAAKVLALSGDQFALSYAASVREQGYVDFARALRDVDLFVVDDIHDLSGRPEAQQALLSAINTVMARGAAVVIAANRNPVEIDRFSPYLVSVLCGGLVVDIATPEIELRRQVIEAALACAGIHVDEDPTGFLARRLGSNLREVKGAISRLLTYAQVQGREITAEFAFDTLASIIRANMRRISIDDIQTSVSAHFHLPKSEMTSDRRAREVARPRQVAMYLSKRLTPRSLPEIGRRFGDRDHTTVIHGIRQIEHLRSIDPELDRDVREIEQGLTQ